ncbi:hypothetical protein THAOC_09822, partial [Thalassiosira oceanica]
AVRPVACVSGRVPLLGLGAVATGLGIGAVDAREKERRGIREGSGAESILESRRATERFSILESRVASSFTPGALALKTQQPNPPPKANRPKAEPDGRIRPVHDQRQLDKGTTRSSASPEHGAHLPGEPGEPPCLTGGVGREGRMAVTGDAIPSAPPLSELGRGGKEDIPLVHASLEGPPNSSHPVATDAIQPENLAGSSAPPGMMVAKSVTTTYPDGRTTVTEYAPMDQGQTVSRAPAPVAGSMARPGDGEDVAAAPAVNQSTYPRRDLGTRPATVTCPYCRLHGEDSDRSHCLRGKL